MIIDGAQIAKEYVKPRDAVCYYSDKPAFHAR